MLQCASVRWHNVPTMTKVSFDSRSAMCGVQDAGVSSADAIGCIQVQQCHDIQTLIAILHRAGQQLKVSLGHTSSGMPGENWAEWRRG